MIGSQGLALAGLLAAALSAATAQEVRSADGVVLRGLDRLSGERTDLTIAKGETARLGRLAITLSDCRYPADNPAGDAFAFLTIDDAQSGAPLFSGWMIASSPALNALEHMRYDVWVMRCSSA